MEPWSATVLAPGWTSYSHRLRYQTFDVTTYLRQGANALGVILGDGWYRGRLGFGGGRRNIYGNRLAVLAQLEMTYSDGRTERFVSDEGWRAATGPIWRATSMTAKPTTPGSNTPTGPLPDTGITTGSGTDIGARPFRSSWRRPGRRFGARNTCSRRPSARRRRAAVFLTSVRTLSAGFGLP